ncbi:MAG: hypothetical protein COW42_12580 [Deltaproteobacteria bacterium CG17_big_fil_post_rev_8_21_14_2_50_63_7]|nr:MAG: hypothetical protein COW42_12580 [Deltaproteobacteria bacterium CG17_big_fil_post_rev_8_21_14_2_50_63_7]
MVRGATLNKETRERITAKVDEFLVSSNARAVLLVDRTGQPVAEAGEMRGFSVAKLAALAVADFAASEQISTLLSNPLGVVREQNAHLGEVRGGRARRSMQAMPSIVEADRRCHRASGDAQMGRLFPDDALARSFTKAWAVRCTWLVWKRSWS